MGKLTLTLVFFICIAFSQTAISECTSASDCTGGSICVSGECSLCGPQNAGLPCSDTPDTPYFEDGICSYDSKCVESMLCLNPSIGKPVFGCSSCENGSGCDTRPSGEFTPDGVCLNTRCMSGYCSSTNSSYPQTCGQIEVACSELSEGRPCDYVGDGEFIPEGKKCNSGNCSKILQQPKSPGSTDVNIAEKPPSPFLGQGNAKPGDSPATLAELVFGPIILERELFMAFAFMAGLASYFVFIRTRRLFFGAASTRERQLATVQRAVLSAFLFLLTFQLGRLSNYYISFLFVLSVVVAIILSDNYLRKVKESRQAIKV